MQPEEWRVYANNILAIFTSRPCLDEALLRTILAGFEAAERELTDYARFLAVRGVKPQHWPMKEAVDAHEAIKTYRQGVFVDHSKPVGYLVKFADTSLCAKPVLLPRRMK